MTHDDAFLQAIIESPDDDAPRLVYADWLDDHGGPAERARAEFIRVQCALTAGRPEDRRSRKLLELREKGLWTRHGKRWAEPLRDLAVSVGFRRGFAENIIVDARREDLASRVQHLLRQAPVRYLQADSCWESSADLAALGPSLTRLKGLMLTNIFDINERGLRRLLTSPHLAGLETLVVHCNHNGLVFGPEFFRAVVASPRWTRLTELSLQTACFIGLNNAEVLALARSPCMAGLTRLDLANVRMQVTGAKALARSPYLTRLTELNLGGCVIGKEGGPIRGDAWRPLMDSPNLANLRWLGLADAYVDETVAGMWKERFAPDVLDFKTGPWVPWLRHRWNRYFPSEESTAFLVEDCGRAGDR
jgi:uncharacterized protein (TIGR02996 family)